MQPKTMVERVAVTMAFKAAVDQIARDNPLHCSHRNEQKVKGKLRAQEARDDLTRWCRTGFVLSGVQLRRHCKVGRMPYEQVVTLRILLLGAP